jgi:hypothetical protein
VPGPEQGLVGESRSDRQRGTAEEAEPGERGVGEIALAVELRRHIERMTTEARQWESLAIERNLVPQATFFCGKSVALDELLETLDRISKERSDLANIQGMARRPDAPPEIDGLSPSPSPPCSGLDD